LSQPPTAEPRSPSSSAPAPQATASAEPARAKRPGRRTATPWEDDQALVREILAGSRPHFDMLYDAYFPRVYRFALKRLRDSGEAEDVTQEVFITVFRALRTFQGDSSLLVWIFGITRNKVNRRFRRPRPRLESIESDALEVAGDDAATDQTVDARRILDRCQHAIEHQLTPLQRRIFHLKHLRRQSIRTIAGSLGKSEDAIKANLYRMRRAIAAAAPGLEQLLEA
jgi:RNA polymerase sigma-70 factor (ECF subfamily)